MIIMVVNNSFSSFPIAGRGNVVMNNNTNSIFFLDEFSSSSRLDGYGNRKTDPLNVAVADALMEKYHNTNNRGKSKWDKIGTRAGHRAKSYSDSVTPPSQPTVFSGYSYQSSDIIRNYQPMIAAADEYATHRTNHRKTRGAKTFKILEDIAKNNVNIGISHRMLYFGDNTIADCISRYLSHDENLPEGTIIYGVVDYARYVKSVLLYSKRA